MLRLPKIRFLVLYGLTLGSLLSLMTWSNYQLMVIDHATELYILLLSVVFVGVGIWVGLRWSAPASVAGEAVKPTQAQAKQLDQQALTHLGISIRELAVLIELSRGLSNEEIASQLFVSTNTVKTHLGNLYAKLDVKRRTQAIDRARALGLIP